MHGTPQISAHAMAEFSASSGGARIQRLSTDHLIRTVLTDKLRI
jgi:hypothetical protein